VGARGAAFLASAPTAATAAVTVANRLGDLSATSLASTAAGVGDGKLWLVLTSGLLADRPAVPSLLGFWIVGFAVLLFCSARLAAGVALAGHTFSALAIYGAIGLTRIVDPPAFGSIRHLSDYGLSAMIAAWIGAIACTLWLRRPSAAARALVVIGSAGCAGIGILFRPDLTFLDSEHLVAYAIGVALVAPPVRERLQSAANVVARGIEGVRQAFVLWPRQAASRAR
jgi:hypothetical protein